MPDADVAPFIRALAAAHPDAKSELHYASDFQLLVAVVMSAQTTDAAVNKVTPALFALAPDAAAMARLSPDDVRELPVQRNRDRRREEIRSGDPRVEVEAAELPDDRRHGRRDDGHLHGGHGHGEHQGEDGERPMRRARQGFESIGTPPPSRKRW